LVSLENCCTLKGNDCCLEPILTSAPRNGLLLLLLLLPLLLLLQQ
jgi:hypothetical protein